jgi:hypothetical protein
MMRAIFRLIEAGAEVVTKEQALSASVPPEHPELSSRAPFAYAFDRLNRRRLLTWCKSSDGTWGVRPVIKREDLDLSGADYGENQVSLPVNDDPPPATYAESARPETSDSTVTRDGPYDGLIEDLISKAEARGRKVSKILLIAALREISGLGLKEAKDAVEGYGYRRVLRAPWLYGR